MLVHNMKYTLPGASIAIDRSEQGGDVSIGLHTSDQVGRPNKPIGELSADDYIWMSVNDARALAYAFLSMVED